MMDAISVDAESAESALVDAAFEGDRARVDELLARFPALESSHASRLARGLETRVDPNDPLPPLGLPPLLYVCFSRIAGDKTSAASTLLSAGADPSAGAAESETLRGYRTALGGAARANNTALLQLLLDAGADPEDAITLWEGSAMWEAVKHHNHDAVRLLTEAGAPQWHLCHALPQSLAQDDLEFSRFLLEHGADPNWTMGAWGFDGSCLHEAVVLGCSAGMIELLIEHGARVNFEGRDGRTPLQLAVSLNRREAADTLVRRGADTERVRDLDRWIATCFAGSGDSALPGDDVLPVDHLWIVRATRANDARAVRRLARLLDVDAMDDDGDYALHVAARAKNTDLCDALLQAGADATLRNFNGETPLDLAHGADPDLLDLLKQGKTVTPMRFDEPEFAQLFESAADAVVDGDMATLSQLLACHPELAIARSARPHRCTLLNYLAANGVEHERARTPRNAVEVIDLLIRAGVEPNAQNFTYRGGPQNDTLGLLISSGIPQEAGLALSMVSALVRGGARADSHLQLLSAFCEADTPEDAVRDVDPVAPRTHAAFVYLASEPRTGLLRALLGAGVDVNCTDAEGKTALHEAAFWGRVGVVEFLLANGADKTLQDTVHRGTAEGWAEAGGHPNVARLIRQTAGNRP